MDDDPPSSSSFSIQGEGEIQMEITLIEIDRLHLHEETIPESLESLTKAIESKGIVEDPIIIDKETLVVLDGMHRVKALLNLRCRLMPVCLVDYGNSQIKVERWCRTVRDQDRTEEIPKTIAARGYSLKEMPIREAKRLLEERETLGILETKQASYVVASQGHADLLSAYRSIGKLEQDLKSKGFKIGYETETDAEDRIRRGTVNAAILPPKISKREVIEAATQGELFVHKATRHIIPARPMGVNVLISDLREDNPDTEKVRDKFKRTLREKRLTRIPPGNLWKGRRYDEALYVFE